MRYRDAPCCARNRRMQRTTILTSSLKTRERSGFKVGLTVTFGLAVLDLAAELAAEDRTSAAHDGGTCTSSAQPDEICLIDRNKLTCTCRRLNNVFDKVGEVGTLSFVSASLRSQALGGYSAVFQPASRG